MRTASTHDTDPNQIDPLAYLSNEVPGPDPKAGITLTRAERQEHCQTVKPALARLYASDRATFAVAAELVKEKLGIGRRDLEASVKPLLGEDEKDSKPLPLARFPELVDLVEEEGEVRFLVR